MQSKVVPQPEEYYSYDRLEKASEKLHLNPAAPENEERLMNLHNHLVWGSYHFGNNEIADAIFCAAIRDVMNEYNLQKSDIPVVFVTYLDIMES